MPDLTPFQTVGPYFAVVYPRDESHPADPAEPVQVLEGRVLDGAGAPVPDALLEAWGADARGQYAEAGVAGFSRALTDPDGWFALRFSRPGPVRLDDRSQAPHLALAVLARGVLTRLVTRVYFADRAPEADPVLALVPAERRATLVAKLVSPDRYALDLRLQGAAETVFFDV
ncbi:MAG: protocatechuate 3,4-dioxygenase subunit alpha [Gemmatimonadales bacterium]